MPLAGAIADRTRVGIFNNAVNKHQSPLGKRSEILRLLDVSNAPDFRYADRPELDMMPESALDARVSRPNSSIVQIGNGDRVSSVDPGPHARKDSGSHLLAGGLCAAMKQNPWTTGVVLTFTAFSVVALVSKVALIGSSSMIQTPEDMPRSEPMVFNRYSPPDDDGVADVCEKAIESFPRVSREYVDRTAMSALNSVKIETDKMVTLAQSMVQEDEVETFELEEAAQCSGRLKRDKVEVMISDLEAMRLDALGAEGISRGDQASAARVWRQVARIDERLTVLRDMRRNLHDVTAALNGRIFSNVD